MRFCVKERENWNDSVWKPNKREKCTFPCVVLDFETRWNDYGYCTVFYIYYFKDENTNAYIGTTKILQKNEKITTLPVRFDKLDIKEFISNTSFEKDIGISIEIKEQILSSLCDVNHNRITEDKLDSAFHEGYKKSLFRDEQPPEYYLLNSSILKLEKTEKLFNENNENEIKKLLCGNIIVILEDYLKSSFRDFFDENKELVIKKIFEKQKFKDLFKDLKKKTFSLDELFIKKESSNEDFELSFSSKKVREKIKQNIIKENLKNVTKGIHFFEDLFEIPKNEVFLNKIKVYNDFRNTVFHSKDQIKIPTIEEVKTLIIAIKEYISEIENKVYHRPKKIKY